MRRLRTSHLYIGAGVACAAAAFALVAGMDVYSGNATTDSLKTLPATDRDLALVEQRALLSGSTWEYPGHGAGGEVDVCDEGDNLLRLHFGPAMTTGIGMFFKNIVTSAPIESAEMVANGCGD